MKQPVFDARHSSTFSSMSLARSTAVENRSLFSSGVSATCWVKPELEGVKRDVRG
ncbi:hypothetical protein L873DRAFT_1818398 [Choiromyces venosus 120613-1]|uniref:Uncharacterized protein n=1 Tax=Choiromyces venosus 120613-1 TaxID=1336337 RepID=A0A3N4J1A0_9PEZI|nr:hypothetical protein L873DRAFT_1818398 [Choiromyces venosus 120613-1]